MTVGLLSFWGKHAPVDGLQSAVDAVIEPGVQFLVLFVAAVVCEGIVEYLIAPWFDKWENSGGEPEVVEQVLRLLTAVLGIAAAWQLDLQFFRTAFGVESLSSWFDLGVTGVAIGRGSNYIHDLIGSLRHKF